MGQSDTYELVVLERDCLRVRVAMLESIVCSYKEILAIHEATRTLLERKSQLDANVLEEVDKLFT